MTLRFIHTGNQKEYREFVLAAMLSGREGRGAAPLIPVLHQENLTSIQEFCAFVGASAEILPAEQSGANGGAEAMARARAALDKADDADGLLNAYRSLAPEMVLSCLDLEAVEVRDRGFLIELSGRRDDAAVVLGMLCGR